MIAFYYFFCSIKMLRTLSTYYDDRRKSCTTKVMEKFVYGINKSVILLHIILKGFVIFSVYKRRPSRVDNEMYSYCNAIIATNVSCMMYVLPFLYTNKIVHSVFQYLTLIVNSIIFSIYWWTIVPDFLHSLPWSYVYLAHAFISSITLFGYILFSNSQLKKRRSIAILPYRGSVPYAKTVLPNSSHINKSVNVSVSV